jgi:hypothetical protein
MHVRKTTSNLLASGKHRGDECFGNHAKRLRLCFFVVVLKLLGNRELNSFMEESDSFAGGVDATNTQVASVDSSKRSHKRKQSSDIDKQLVNTLKSFNSTIQEVVVAPPPSDKDDGVSELQKERHLIGSMESIQNQMNGYEIRNSSYKEWRRRYGAL